MPMDKQEDEIHSQNDFISHPKMLAEHPLTKSTSSKMIEDLCQNYTSYRSIKADNNCFYTSFLSTLPLLCSSLPDQEFNTLLNQLSFINEKYELLSGYQSSIFVEFYESFVDFVNVCRIDSTVDISTFEEMNILSMVTYLKMVISTELQSSQEIYQPFIAGMSVPEYCRDNVDPLYADVDYVGIQAFSNALKISIKVFSADRNKDWVEFNGDSPSVCLLHHENHFEPIF